MRLRADELLLEACMHCAVRSSYARDSIVRIVGETGTPLAQVADHGRTRVGPLSNCKAMDHAERERKHQLSADETTDESSAASAECGRASVQGTGAGGTRLPGRDWAE
jgi:hypothetical protein